MLESVYVRAHKVRGETWVSLDDLLVLLTAGSLAAEEVGENAISHDLAGVAQFLAGIAPL